MEIVDIYKLAEECRELAKQGASFNREEAALFANSLRLKDTEMCNRLIETLKRRVKTS